MPNNTSYSGSIEARVESDYFEVSYFVSSRETLDGYVDTILLRSGEARIL